MNQATDLLQQPFNSRSEARVGNKCICQGLNKCFLKPRWYFSRAKTKQLYYMLYGSLLSRDGRQPRHTHTHTKHHHGAAGVLRQAQRHVRSSGGI